MHQLQAPVKLSDSMIWRLNREFYESEGLDAWTNGFVPSRVTSNPMIAHAYAEVIIGYLRDVANAENSRQAGNDKTPPQVTILEIGAGSGQFAFLLARALAEMVPAVAANCPVASFRHVMTDAVERNVLAWLTHPSLKALIDAGVLDAAVLDVRAPRSARSVVSQQPLAQVLAGGPVVLLANYVFDSLVNDAFRAENGKLFEVRIGLKTEEALQNVSGSKDLLKKIRFVKELAAIELPYYGEAEFDNILAVYRDQLVAGTFVFPIEAMRFLRELSVMAGDRMLVLASDKADFHISQFEGRTSLGIHPTGAFGGLANMDAIARWTKGRGGAVKTTASPAQLFDTFALVIGETGACGETELAFDRRIRHCGPGALYHLVSAVLKAKPALEPRALLGLLELTCDDPYVVGQLGGVFLGAAGAAVSGERTELREALERSRANGFEDIECRDVSSAMGRVFHELGEPQLALDCLAESVSRFGARSWIAYQMSLCHNDLGCPAEALECLRQAALLKHHERMKRTAA